MIRGTLAGVYALLIVALLLIVAGGGYGIAAHLAWLFFLAVVVLALAGAFAGRSYWRGRGGPPPV